MELVVPATHMVRIILQCVATPAASMRVRELQTQSMHICAPSDSRSPASTKRGITSISGSPEASRSAVATMVTAATRRSVMPARRNGPT